MSNAFTKLPSAGILLLALGVLAVFSAGCTIGPKYTRPRVEAPDTFRGVTPEEAARAELMSLGDERWWEVFHNPQLQELIRTALESNYDLRIAAARVQQARAQLGVTRAGQFPTVTAGAGASNQRTPASGPFPGFDVSSNQVDASLSWELDFWGKFRRATEAARANLLASEWAGRAVRATLVGDLAAAYFQLRELDLELEISKRTLASREDSLRLTRLLADRGVTSMLDVRQAEQLVHTAAAQIPDIERRIEQEENFISVLLGDNPAAIPRGQRLTEQVHAPDVPAGLPSSLLERRPDIRQAELVLIAANAQIGVARSAYFPQISLTGTGGYRSSALTDLFSGPAGLWNFGGSLLQPIFTDGRIRSNVQLAEERQQEALLAYRQAIQQAFREISDALVAYRKNQEFRIQQELLARAAQDAARLSDLRYRGGQASYLEVLTNETNYFTAELGLAQARLNEFLALVQLYRALGGGWQQ